MSDTHDDNAPRDRADTGAERAGAQDAATEPARPHVDPSILAEAAARVRAATDAAEVVSPDVDARAPGTAVHGAVSFRPSALPPAAGASDESGDTTAPAASAAETVAAEAVAAETVAAETVAAETVAAEEDGPAVAVDVADPDAEALGAIPLPVRLEAALFAATEALPLKRLKEITGCPDGRLLRDTLDVLAASYAEHGRAFRVEEVAQGFQLRTSAEVAVVVQRLGRRGADEKLSTAALETLAVVAYRQPVLRADIERIRGVACGEVLRALQERGLVRAAGRADLPGSPILYGTTHRFLEIFGLRDIQDLPKDREVLRRPD